MGIWDTLSSVKWFDDKNANGAITAPQDLGAIHKFGLVLENISDPTTISRYNNEYKRDQVFQKQQQQQSALQQLAQDPNFAALSPAEQLRQTAAITGDVSPLAQYNASQQITPYQQAQLGLEQQRIAASRNQNKFQFISNPDGSVSVGDPRTGQLAQLTQSPITQAGLTPGQGTTLPNGKVVTLDENGKPLYGVDPVTGFVPVAGAVPTADDAKKLKAANASAIKLDGLLKKADELAEKYGSEYGGKGEQELNQNRTAITLELKNINELGALAGPDQGILDSTQGYNLTGSGANLRGLFPVPFVSSPSDLAKLSNSGLRDQISKTLSAGSAAAGYRPVKAASGNSTGGWSIKPKGGN